MGNIKIKGFDTEKLMCEIKKDIEKDLTKNPGKVLDNHAGEEIKGDCPRCGKTTPEVLSGGKAKCKSCGQTAKVNLKINYR